MTLNALLPADAADLDRRRLRAARRTAREREREELLDALLHAERRHDELARWVTKSEQALQALQDPDLARMLKWARLELRRLKQQTHPASVADALRARNLFPETDDLVDPQGDPPARRPWGR